MKTFKTLIQRFPDDVALKNELGVSYLMIGQNDRARDVFKEVCYRNIDYFTASRSVNIMKVGCNIYPTLSISYFGFTFLLSVFPSTF